MRTLIVMAALASAAPALAANNEISLEVGTLSSNHQTYNRFSEGDGMPSYGLRLGLGMTDRVALIGGYHRVRRGATVDTATRGWGASYLVDELTLGFKANLPMQQDVWALYATASAVGYRGTMRFDGEPNKKNNLDQIRASALSVGGIATAGVEVFIKNSSPLTPSLHVELGGGGVLRHRYNLTDDNGNSTVLGEMSVAGIAAKAGVGIRF